MAFSDKLERKINSKLKKIKNGTEKVEDSNINNMITRLKETDEASAEELLKKYVEVVKEINKK